MNDVLQQEAFEMYALNGAYAMRLEDVTGSLKVCI